MQLPHETENQRGRLPLKMKLGALPETMETQISVIPVKQPELSLQSTRSADGGDGHANVQCVTVIDRAAVFAVLTNTASLVLGPVTALLVATHFAPELQGFYYTFGSLTALQFLIELGLGQTIIQFASHEWANLRIDGNGRITGDPDSLSRLISLGRLSLVWCGVSAVLVILVLGPTGYLFFSRSSTSGIQWMWPWLALCVGIGFSVLLAPMFSLLQGCNQVSQFWFYRFVQQILNGLSLWAAILLGAKLWTLPIAVAIGLIWSIIFLRTQASAFLSLLLASPLGSRLSWLRDVWPVQWRIAVSWLSGYFTISLFAPILFQLSGPVAAGQMGLTATLCSVLLAMSSNWVVTKAPRFGMLVAQQKYRELDQLFLRSLIVSLVVVCCGAAAIFGLIYELHAFHHPLASRILQPLPAGLFLLATVITSATTCLWTYLRAHKRETLATIFLCTAIFTLLLAVLLGTHLGAVGITAAYLAVVVSVQFPFSLHIFRRCRAEWHKERLARP